MNKFTNQISNAMGTVKIELDLPNFEKEIELKVIINKDGVQSSTPLIDRKIEPINCQLPSDASGQAWKQSLQHAVVAHPDPTTSVYGSGTLSAQTQPQVAPAQQVSKPIPSSMMGTF